MRTQHVREYQKCRKCGKIYTVIERTGPNYITHMADSIRHSHESVCRHCGGSIIWMDDDGNPLSVAKRDAEANRVIKLGCLVVIIALIGFFLLYYLVLR